MSRGASTVLGIAMLLGAVGFIAIGATLGHELPKGATPFYGMAAFCLVVVLACFVRRSRPVTLRITGAVIFLGYVVYAVTSVGERRFWEALGGLIVWGLPAGYVMVTGDYPVWGRASPAFVSDPQHDDDEDSNNEFDNDEDV